MKTIESLSEAARTNENNGSVMVSKKARNTHYLKAIAIFLVGYGEIFFKDGLIQCTLSYDPRYALSCHSCVAMSCGFFTYLVL